MDKKTQEILEKVEKEILAEEQKILERMILTGEI